MNKFREKFLTWFGDIKLLPYPPFLYYQKGSYYKVSGDDCDDLRKFIKEGDVICRGYDSYLDGYFIPGEYTHSGVYAGDGKVIHAVAEGVCECSLIDFLRCDRFVLLRPRYGSELAVIRARDWIGIPYDFNFEIGTKSMYCHELTASCYSELDILKVTPYIGKLKLRFLTKKYLAESFINSPDFVKVYEVNPKRKIKGEIKHEKIVLAGDQYVSDRNHMLMHEPVCKTQHKSGCSSQRGCGKSDSVCKGVCEQKNRGVKVSDSGSKSRSQTGSLKNSRGNQRENQSSARQVRKSERTPQSGKEKNGK